MMEGDEYIQASEESQGRQNPKKKKSKLENRKRFSDEQIRSLECIFESESKLEPRKKMQLAQDLELQPRQVAIWFQNRRARWKSKRIEQEYRKLKDEYDNLASRFETLKKENESLQTELQKLTDLMETSHVGIREESTENGGSGSGQSNWWAEAKPSFSNECFEDREGTHSDDQNDKSTKIGYAENKGYQLQRLDDQLEVPLGSLEKWYSGDPSGFLDQSCSTSQLLDFWN